MIKRTQQIGTARWNGVNPQVVDLLYIPRHENPQVGDTIVTSGYNAVFPPNVLVGVVKERSLGEEAPFWEIKVQLAQDFGKIAFVEVVKSYLKQEIDSLEMITTGQVQ
jgi:rod shape-determining protein MreC